MTRWYERRPTLEVKRQELERMATQLIRRAARRSVEYKPPTPILAAPTSGWVDFETITRLAATAIEGEEEPVSGSQWRNQTSQNAFVLARARFATTTLTF